MVNSNRMGLKRLTGWRPRGQSVGYLYVLPAILFLLVFTVYPLAQAAVMSVTQVSTTGKIGAWNNLANWLRLFQDGVFLHAVGLSLQFAVMGTVGSIVFGLILAQLLNLRWLPPGLTNLLRGLAVLPWMFATAVAALMWGLLLHRDGLINAWLNLLKLTHVPILFVGNPNTALASLAAVFAWRVIPFIMVMVLAGLKSIPQDLYEAASVDGANTWQVYWRITLPLVMPLILTLSILTFVWGVGQYDLIRIITGGGPIDTTQVVSFYIYRVGFLTLDWGYGATISIAVFLVNTVCAVIYLYLSRRARPWD